MVSQKNLCVSGDEIKLKASHQPTVCPVRDIYTQGLADCGCVKRSPYTLIPQVGGAGYWRRGGLSDRDKSAMTTRILKHERYAASR
jgi:hypothetical protein